DANEDGKENAGRSLQELPGSGSIFIDASHDVSVHVEDRQSPQEPEKNSGNTGKRCAAKDEIDGIPAGKRGEQSGKENRSPNAHVFVALGRILSQRCLVYAAAPPKKKGYVVHRFQAIPPVRPTGCTKCYSPGKAKKRELGILYIRVVCGI